MAPISNVKLGRRRSGTKGGTASSKKHRFEPFNRRIEKLHIDPVRRSRRHDVDPSDSLLGDSFFQMGLGRWRELNLSTNFTEFSRRVGPFCESLPQVIYHHQQLMDIIVDSIEKRDSLSLEPLLSLLANLAQDLGSRFEPHLSRAVKLVTSLAASHSDVAVIEWSFSCVAWLFKYLSRLLVPDLRPIFCIMAPFLGKTPQNMHTARFAAEAMSFLLRKSALQYHSNPVPLRMITQHMLEDLAAVDTQSSNRKLYQFGLMTLISDTIKGVRDGLSLSGVSVYHCLLDIVLDAESSFVRDIMDVIRGVTVSILHHTNASTFEPIINMIIQRVTSRSKDLAECNPMFAHLIFVCLTVRKSSRIMDWAPIVNALVLLLEQSSDIYGFTEVEDGDYILKIAAVVLETAPIDVILPKLQRIMDLLTSERNSNDFLLVCSYLSTLNHKRFMILMYSYFQKFLSKWRGNEDRLCTIIPRVIEKSQDAGTTVPNSRAITLPAPWQEYIIQKFECREAHETEVTRYNAYVRLIETASVESSTREKVIDQLGIMVKNSLECAEPEPRKQALFSLGAGLRAYLKYRSLADNEYDIWSQLCSSTSTLKTLPPFLEALQIYLDKKTYPSIAKDDETEVLAEAMISNLASSSGVLRSLSLRILQRLILVVHNFEANILTTAMSIEELPLELQSARTISMHVRRIAGQYQEVSSNTWLQKAIPYYCLGLLSFKLSPVWVDATAALKEFCHTKLGEDIVSDIVFRWLEEPATLEIEEVTGSNLEPRQQLLTDFDCSNLSMVEKIMFTCNQEFRTAFDKLTEVFDSHHRMLLHIIPEAPSKALRVLLGNPQLAERRSRSLVPIFLRRTTRKLGKEFSNSTVSSSRDLEGVSDYALTRKDLQDMLELFGQFTNPSVLYKASDVLDSLLSLLTNGDSGIQKSALKAIFTWKNPAIQPYQENLLNLLDDARFREEISIFVRVRDESGIIREEHRGQLMPVLLRILYGRAVAKGGSTNGRTGQDSRRRAVLSALGQLGETEIDNFVKIMVAPLQQHQLMDGAQWQETPLSTERLKLREQLGFVNMMKDMLETLAGKLTSFASVLADGLMYCLVSVCRQLATSEAVSCLQEHESQLSLLKDVRRVGMQCLTLLFQTCSSSAMQAYVPEIFAEVIYPRLEKLPIETAQSISGLLRLVSVWAAADDTVFIFERYNGIILRKVVDCLEVSSAKDEVKLFVLEDILMQVVEFAIPETAQKVSVEFSKQVRERLIQPNLGHLLEQVGGLLRKSPSNDLLASTVRFVSKLAPAVAGSSEIGSLLEVSVFLLNQPSHRISPKTKGNLLRIVKYSLSSHDFVESSGLQQAMLSTISSLFGYFKDRENRLALTEVLHVLSRQDKDLEEVASLCIALNSFSPQRLDEPDFEQRRKAFKEITESKYREFSVKQWRPILFNMLFFIKEKEEPAIRFNASLVLRRFIESITSIIRSPEHELVGMVLLPCLRNGASEPSELVRTEYLAVMAHLVRCECELVSDMSGLLMDGDEEASFFTNILHIQFHRRLRALRRLATITNEGGHLRSVNVAHFFIPLIEHFIFEKSENESSHNLAAEATSTIGVLAKSLEWTQIRAILARYSGYIRNSAVEKRVIKLLGAIIDALSHATYQASQDHRNTLSSTMPKAGKIAADLRNNLLPSLMSYLHDKDESTVSLRIPVALSVVKVVMILPHEQIQALLPPVLTDLSNILRSRGQESRDITRRTLVEIATLIGPSYFGFILKELRTALARGYQLHVLSFTVHAILVASTSTFKPGDLDYCLSQIVSIIMDDIFGAIGQEKEAEEYVSKMREVKSSKSYDSMELLATTATVRYLSGLVKPLQMLLEEELDHKMINKIDKLLRRIGTGLLRNDAIQSREALLFCYELLQDMFQRRQHQDQILAKENQPQARSSVKECYGIQRYLVASRREMKYGSRPSASSYGYKIACFSLDLLRSILQKHATLKTAENLAGFMPVVGDALVDSQEEIQTAALRLLTSIIKVPVPEIDKNARDYIDLSVKVIRESASTKTELGQAALKLISAILREKPEYEVSEKDTTYLLKLLKPDLEEPSQQGIAFKFLKAIMKAIKQYNANSRDRKTELNELYDVMDTVAYIMITNQSRGARDMSRSVYFQFIMEFPQGEARFNKHLFFLVKNLEYELPDGRQSVMEAMYLLISHIDDQEWRLKVINTFFVPLALTMHNDESPECRKMAGALLKTLFERVDAMPTHTLIAQLRKWLGQDDDPSYISLALQLINIYLETAGGGSKYDIHQLQIRLSHILKSGLTTNVNGDWERLYFTLRVCVKLCQVFPASAFTASSALIWATVPEYLLYAHAWVKISAAELLGIYLADFARSNANTEITRMPLKGSGGLLLGEEMTLQIIRASLGLLRMSNVSEELATQTVRNLVFLGRKAASVKLTWKPRRMPAASNAAEEDAADTMEKELYDMADPQAQSALQHIFERCSAILRRESINSKALALVPKTAALQLMATLCSSATIYDITHSIQTILLPLQNLTDASIPAPFSLDQSFTTAYQALISTSREIMALLQKRLGTAEYITQLSRVRKGVEERREGRKVKRRIEAVAEPEKVGKEKKKKGEKKREKRKERSGEQRSRRRGW